MADIKLRRLDGVSMTISISTTRELRWRLAVGMFFIKLGVRITGMGVTVEQT